MPTMAIARAIEVAEHNGWYEGNTLVVFDATKQNRYFGVKLEVEPAATDVGGFCARCKDGVGNATSVWNTDREIALRTALGNYLKIVNL